MARARPSCSVVGPLPSSHVGGTPDSAPYLKGHLIAQNVDRELAVYDTNCAQRVETSYLLVLHWNVHVGNVRFAQGLVAGLATGLLCRLQCTHAEHDAHSPWPIIRSQEALFCPLKSANSEQRCACALPIHCCRRCLILRYAANGESWRTARCAAHIPSASSDNV
eukprot:561518-Pleurochrysis_carterae.AAC.3